MYLNIFEQVILKGLTHPSNVSDSIVCACNRLGQAEWGIVKIMKKVKKNYLTDIIITFVSGKYRFH